MDPRWQQLAEILVRYSTAIRPGERVLIGMQECATLPLVQAVYAEAVRAGALVQVLYQSETLRRALLCHGSDEQAAWVPEMEARGMEWADVYFGLRGAHNPYELADIPSERLALNQRAQGRISALRWAKTRWCLVRVPNAALAQQAETDLHTALDVFFAACLRDWAREGERMARLVAVLAQGSQVRLLGRDTDLTFSVAGRRWLVADGHMNMPDGEILTAPVEDSVEGHIYFELPGVISGQQVHDIRLEWRAGRLVHASASRNEALLRRVLESDEGASRVGEFAFGTNDGLTRQFKDLLLDEKIGGTVHLAVGRAYPECGGENKSDIHWDIVKDLRQEGEVYLDGKLVFAEGRFVIRDA